MILHVIRHGQVLPCSHPDAPPCAHPGDPLITDLGRQQAHHLGEELREDGFAGPIFTSPYRRTVCTAVTVADVTGSPVIPAGVLREMVMRDGQMDGFHGADAETLSGEFSHISEAPPASLSDRWWTCELETSEEVTERVRPFIADVIQFGIERGEDALIVGHGATVNGTLTSLLSTHDPEHVDHHRGNWNCALSSFELSPAYRLVRLNDISHLPDESVTSNGDQPDAAALRGARA